MIHPVKSSLRNAAFFALLLTASAPVFAQVPDAQTGTASPDRVEEQTRLPELKRSTLPQVDVRQTETQGAPQGAENITFTLNTLQLDGVTAYSEEELREIYGPSIGQTISLAELYGIAAQLTKKYRNDGFVLTQVVVPPQTIEGGNVRLQVVEGYIYSVNVGLEENAPAEGDSALALIRDYASNITTGRALNVKDLERYMLLINDLPGVSARGVLSPSPAHTGAADLNILVQRDPFEALLAADNYGTKFLGAIQFSGAASTNSYFGNNERLTAQAVVAPDPGQPVELAYFAAGYAQPVGGEGMKIALSANHSMTEPGYTLDEFDVKGKSTVFGIAVDFPWIRTRATNLFVSLGFDARNVDTRNNVEDTRKDRIRALRASAHFEHLDNIFGAGMNVFNVELSQGMDIFGASGDDDLNKSRPDGDPTFTKLTLEAQRLQRLTDQWNLLVGAQGQVSNKALLSSEEFGVGGMGYGRGYDPSEIIGDEGFAGKIEVQWNVPGEFLFTHDNQLFGFADIGRVWNDDAAANNQKSDTVSSAGFGVRAEILDYTNLDMTVAVPLNRDVQTMSDQDPRFFMRLSQRF